MDEYTPGRHLRNRPSYLRSQNPKNRSKFAFSGQALCTVIEDVKSSNTSLLRGSAYYQGIKPVHGAG
jgi:hypothetical protein